MAEDSAVAQVAASVADGEPVDWTEAHVRVAERDRRLIPHLRLVQSISYLYRTLPIDDAEPAAETPPVRQWGSLVLLERIGEGTTGEVYRAWDSRLHRDVALKLLHPGRHSKHDAQQRVLEEARWLARLRHEHVVSVYGAEEHDGRVGLWMEFVRGESLEERVRTRGPVESAEAVRIGRQLCSALSAVHASGLLHRDVKAQNVIQEPSGRIVLMDFGTGEQLRQAAGTNRLVGTPLYLAPEIFQGEPATVQTDLYSLGVLLFFLATGQFPVKAGSMQELGRAHTQGTWRRLSELRPDLPRALAAAVERALYPAPSRYRSAGEFDTALRQVHEVPVGTESRGGLHWRVSRGARMAAAAVALALVVLTLIVWTRIGSGPTITRLGVMPFTHGPGADVPVIADALTDELIATLGQIESLRVIARASAAPFQGSSESPGVIATALGADALLLPELAIVRDEGAAPHARVHVRLIAAGSGATMWAQTYERELGATPALLADVARGLTEEVDIPLRLDTSRRLNRIPATTQAAAEAYFTGLHNLKQLSATQTRLAIEAFERALQLDPRHAAARAGLAQSYINLGFVGAITHAEARARALAQIERALELDSESSETRIVSADLKFYYNWDWQGAEAEYQRAIALNGSSARARSQYARFLAASGRADAAVEEAGRAVVLNPLSASAASTLALIHYYKRDYASASKASGEALRLDPKSPGAYFVLSRIHAATGAISDAIQANEQAVALAGVAEAPIGWRGQLVALRARVAPPDEARVMFDELTQELSWRGQSLRPEQLALIHVSLSEPDAALTLLERAADERSPNILFLCVDPAQEPLHGSPRFTQVCARITRANER